MPCSADIELADYQHRLFRDARAARREDKVIVGISGGDYADARASSMRMSRKTGKRIWRFYTGARPLASPAARRGRRPMSLARGGGGTWVTGSYDPELNTGLLGHRQSESRLSTATIARATTCTRASLVALDADTGTLQLASTSSRRTTRTTGTRTTFPVLDGPHDRGASRERS